MRQTCIGCAHHSNQIRSMPRRIVCHQKFTFAFEPISYFIRQWQLMSTHISELRVHTPFGWNRLWRTDGTSFHVDKHSREKLPSRKFPTFLYTKIYSILEWYILLNRVSKYAAYRYIHRTHSNRAFRHSLKIISDRIVCKCVHEKHSRLVFPAAQRLR